MAPLRTLLICSAWLAFVPATAVAAEHDTVEAGRRIYREGRLVSGEPLSGTRFGGLRVSGAAAACIQCHRRSGYGQAEASAVVPPVTGPALFRNQRLNEVKPRRARLIDHEERSFRTRPPYDDTSLLRAIREGISPAGVRLDPLMPRYALGETDAAALIAYLKTLSAEPSPGRDAEGLHFATVIAPGQAADRSEAMVRTLQGCFAESRTPGLPDKRWQLHVWTLDGPPETWRRQLAHKLASRPVFGILSGLGGGEWKPVHDFCESERLPCLFPNVDVPGSAREDDYSFYFSRGVLLEAEVMAAIWAREAAAADFRRLVQIVDTDAASRAASAALRSGLQSKRPDLEIRTIELEPSHDGSKEIAAVGPGDVVALWLRPESLQRLSAVEPPPASATFVSGWLGGGEHAPLSKAWRSVVRMTYAIDAPGRRDLRMSRNLRPWLQEKGISGDEVLLGNTLAACRIVSESMARARGALQRDFLVDLVETYPSGMGNAPAPEAYPRFSLGPGQRYSSKGAYLVRFSGPELGDLEPVYDWLIP